MAEINELFGHHVADNSEAAHLCRKQRACPILQRQCLKTLSDGEISGVCTLESNAGEKVICCPIRLYHTNYMELKSMCNLVFGATSVLVRADQVPLSDNSVNRVVVFGKNWGGELRIPSGNKSSFSVDWVFAQIDSTGALLKFFAVEVQTIDTTNNYRAARQSVLDRDPIQAKTKVGLNWENVNKRILPQIIFKANILSREAKCSDGLFFVCPTPVLERIKNRLVGKLASFPTRDRSSITFCGYTLAEEQNDGHVTALVRDSMLTTSVTEVAHAFSRMRDLAEENVFEKAIGRVL